MNLNSNVSQIIILVAIGLAGAIAIIPYSLALRGEITLKPIMIVLSVVQSLILLSAASIVGLLANRSLGLIIKSDPGKLIIAVLIGLAAGFLVIGIEKFIFSSRLPEALVEAGNASLPLWKRFLACFYGGITEEILMRWFLLSGILWLLTRFLHGPANETVAAAFWIANILVAILFGLGHLPATKMLTELTPLIVSRALILNGIAGLIFGWVFWKYGLAAAMVSHFCADIVLHIIGPVLSRIG
ncbi:MAG TPA: hypothetical protein DCO79_02310 [Spirochaeta sp.]|nr:hypothetical protein [Spirochaeta sp.]